MKAMDCFTCGKAMNNIGDKYHQPDDGVEFTTTGHYGTTVFDPMDGSKIAISICDDCLRLGATQGRILHYALDGSLDLFVD